jgi:hypothetical protein
MATIREVRIILEHKSIQRKVFKLAFSKSDSSIYIFPYSIKNNYYYGTQQFEKNTNRKEFKYNKQFFTNDIPKLSYHQSGQVKICDSKKNLAGPIYAISFNDLTGEHIATVTIDNFNNLPIYNKKLRFTGPERDHVIKSDNIVNSGRIIIYCNAKSKNFNNTKPCNMIISMTRLDYNVNFCLEIRGQEQLIDEGSGGVIVLAGFNPKRQEGTKDNFLFLRAQ